VIYNNFQLIDSDRLQGVIRWPIQLQNTVWRVFSGPVGRVSSDSYGTHHRLQPASFV